MDKNISGSLPEMYLSPVSVCYFCHEKETKSNGNDICHLQYIGETQNALHIQMNGHRSDIKRKVLINQFLLISGFLDP